MKNNKEFNVNKIKEREPFFTINVKLKNGEKTKLHGIRKKSSLKGRSKNKTYDTERFYGVFKNELILIQYQQFEKILKKSSDFSF